MLIIEIFKHSTAFFCRGFESQSAGVAAQPVGFASALQAARERIAVHFIQSHLLIETSCLIINLSCFHRICVVVEPYILSRQ